MSHLQIVTYIGFVSLLRLTKGGSPTDKQNCETWSNVAERAQEEPQLQNATCAVNSECAGLDCTAVFTYAGLNIVMNTYQVCFGMYLNPCAIKGVNLTVYLEVTNQNISFLHSYSSSERSKVDGARFDVSPGTLSPAGSTRVTAQGYIVTDLVPKIKNGQNMLTIGVRYETVISYTIFSHTASMTPTGLTVELLEDHDILLPNCSAAKIATGIISHHNTPTASHTLGICRPVTESHSPEYTGRLCQPNVYASCGHNEVCLPYNGTYVCGCYSGALYDESTQSCISVLLNTGADSSDTPSASTSHRKLYVIPLVVLVSAATLVAAALVVYSIARRRNRQAPDNLVTNIHLDDSEQ